MNNLNKNKFNCTGCGACVNVCPKNAITLKLNKDGFYQYFIDKDKCIECGFCNKICPKINFKNENDKNKINCYAAYSRDKNIVKNSSSGGLFTEIAKFVLNSGGLVAGVTLDQNIAKHILIETEEDLKKLQGSKYLQSFTGNIYLEIKKQIKNRKVLFVGTPCQCAAIRKIINNNNLYVIDIVCHGVPSLNVFQKSLKDRFNINIDNIKFRYKKKSWNNYSLQYFSQGKLIKSNIYYKDEWFMGYLKNLYLMKSCYSCEFNSLPRIGDITLADCWGINNLDKKFYKKNNDKGISLVLLNNKKGQELFDNIKSKIIFIKQDINDYKIYNPRIFFGNYPQKVLTERNNFFNEEINKSFVSKRYSKKNKEIFINKCKSIMKKILGR